MSRPSIYNCNVLDLPQIRERSGCITPVENEKEIPFSIQRIYYLYDVPGGAIRGGHAHKELRQIIVAASGSFEVVLDDGYHKKTVELNRPYFGLLIVPGIWRDLSNFSSGAICLVLASHFYDESDYIRNYGDYLKYAQK
jgi:dTDP-4-dehydrorhamnose 3,5-epimerase-like enzyme